MKWFWQKDKSESAEQTEAPATEQVEPATEVEGKQNETENPAKEKSGLFAKLLGQKPKNEPEPELGLGLGLEPEPELKADPELEPEPESEPESKPEPKPELETKPELELELKPEPETKDGFFSRMATGLQKSSSKLGKGVSDIFTKRKLDEETLEELEDLLISSDLGTPLATKFVAQMAKDRFDKEIDERVVREELATLIADTMSPLEQALDLSGKTPKVVLFVGVNGSGKTTTLGKIAAKIKTEGGKCLLVAGDTFRAAAIEQLQVWGQRTGAEVMSRPLGSDAAGLAYDAIKHASKTGVDVVLMDTAGRLQNKQGLMEELAKIIRVIRKFDADAPHHVLLVLDATVGQNALSQTEAFTKQAGVTGLVMTKLDGTAKGGVLVAVSEKYQLPIHYIGIGENIEDLQNFNAEAFAGSMTGLLE